MNRGVVRYDADWMVFNSFPFPMPLTNIIHICPRNCAQYFQMISTSILFMKAECNQDVIVLDLARPARPCDTASYATFSHTHKVGNNGINANFVFPCICSFLHYLYLKMSGNVKLDVSL